MHRIYLFVFIFFIPLLDFLKNEFIFSFFDDF